MALLSGQPVAGSVLLQCQLQRWKSLQLDVEPSPVLCCAELQIYYRLDVWTGGLTRPGISAWTCSASATLSVGSGGRWAVCKSYQRTLWCLHPAKESRKRDHNCTENKETNRKETAAFNMRFSACACMRKHLYTLLLHDCWTLNPAKFFSIFQNLSTCLEKKKSFIITHNALSHSWTKHNLAALVEKENVITAVCSDGENTGSTQERGQPLVNRANFSSLSMLWLLLVIAFIQIFQYPQSEVSLCATKQPVFSVMSYFVDFLEGWGL